MREPKIAHIIHSGAIGGGPRVVLSLVEHVEAAHLVATADDGPLLDAAQRLGAEVIPLAHTGKMSFALSAPHIARLAARVDIVHVHGQFAAFYAAPVACSVGARVVYTAHFPSFVTDSGLRSKTRNWIAERVSCAAAHANVSCSEFMRREYVRRRLASAASMTTIYNGVSDQMPETCRSCLRDELRVPSDHALVLGLGRFTAQKGFDVLIEAMSEVLAVHPKAILVLVGDGPERDPLHRRARTLGIEASVRFTGFRTDVADLLSAADIVAVPSKYDVFPLVPLESMMAGRAIIVSDLPVLREAIDHDHTGLVSGPSALNMADTILRVVRDPALRTRLGGSARAAALDRFGVERMSSEYASLYERLLA